MGLVSQSLVGCFIKLYWDFLLVFYIIKEYIIWIVVFWCFKSINLFILSVIPKKDWIWQNWDELFKKRISSFAISVCFFEFGKNKVKYNTEPFPVFHIIWIFGLLIFAFCGWVCPILAILGNKYDLYSFLIIFIILKWLMRLLTMNSLLIINNY